MNSAPVSCVVNNTMGKDEVTDFLSVTLSATGGNINAWRTGLEAVYRGLDRTLASLITRIGQAVGTNRVLFVFISTGYTEDLKVSYAKHCIPAGTFYINRTANLLNTYLGAIYGQARYVEICYCNQIYLNRKLIEGRLLSCEDVISRSKDFLIQIAGICDATESPYDPAVSGDLFIEVAPGWQLYNEDNQDNYVVRASFIPFPTIFYGTGIKPQRISLPVTVDHIVPTIAKSIQTRTSNACKSVLLQ